MQYTVECMAARSPFLGALMDPDFVRRFRDHDFPGVKVDRARGVFYRCDDAVAAAAAAAAAAAVVDESRELAVQSPQLGTERH